MSGSSAIGLIPLAIILQLVLAAAAAGLRGLKRGPDRAVDSLAATAGLTAIAGLLALGFRPEGAPVVAGPFRFDILAAVMLSLIAFLGFIILRFSQNYLDGDARRPVFLARLASTLAAVAILVSADHLALFFAAWVATSVLLHALLLHYPDRPRARVAARKKFIFARIGDGFLLLALFLLASAFDTSSIGMILDRSGEAGTITGGGVGLACMLMAAAAALKCAQFPTHGWLTEVMETPTPVSALLHAGIINAGGFLLIRFADVIVLSPSSMLFLIVVGGVSALFGSVVMLTQTSIKGSLAHSTIAQMGFMLLQCGLGVFSAAALHLVAHSLYKAHAFLSSGRAVGAVASRVPARSAPLPVLIGGIAGALAVYLGTALLLPEGAAKSAPVIVLGAIFILGLFVYLVSGSGQAASRLAPALAVTLAAAVSYHLLQAGAAALLASVIPPVPDLDALSLGAMIVVVAAFFLVALLQVSELPIGSGLRKRAYVALARGLYANAANDRLIGALKFKKAI